MQRIAIFGLSAALLAGCGQAQKEQQELIELRDAKLAEDWLEQAPWITDYDEARAQARETGKVIFGYFTRSYSY